MLVSNDPVSGRAGSTHGGSLLVERQTELQALRAAVDGVRSGTGSVVLIRGPLGVGKSALLNTVGCEADRAGVLVLRARAAAMERPFVFGVVRQLLETTLNTVSPQTRDRWLSGAAQHARAVLSDDSLPTSEAHATVVPQDVLRGLSVLVTRICAEQPMIFLVDDLQWADEPSQQVLGYLQRRIDRARLLMVCTLTDGDPRTGRSLVTEVTTSVSAILRPRNLSLEGTRAVLCDAIGRPPTEELVAAGHAASCGNPLFLTSLAHCLPVTDDTAAILGLRPPHLRERIVTHLRAQPGPVAELARAIAVLGESDLELLSRMAGLSVAAGAEALRALQGLGLVSDLSAPQFMVPLVQEAVEESMTAYERELSHMRAAELLRHAGSSPEHVAAQLLGVTGSHGSWAIEVLREAAELATRRGAPQSAARYLRRALLDCEPDGKVRAGLLVELAVAERGFDPAVAVRHMAQALPLLTSARDRARAVVRLVPSVLDPGDVSIGDLYRHLADDLDELRAVPGPDRELAMRLEARLRFTEGSDPGSTVRAVERLHQLGDDPPLATSAERELVAVLLHGAALGTRLTAARVTDIAHRVLAQEPPHPLFARTALPLVVWMLSAADRTEEIDAWIAEAHRRAVRADAVADQALLRAQQAMVRVCQGRLADAHRYAEQAFDMTGRLDLAGDLSCAIAITSVSVELRSPELTARVLHRYQGEHSERFELSTILDLLRGTAAAADGDPSTALTYISETGRRWEHAGWRNPALFSWRSWAATLHHRLGATATAAELAEEAYATAVTWGAPTHIARALRVRATLDQGPGGLKLLDQAMSIMENSPNLLERAKIFIQLGRRLHAGGRDGGDDLLRRGSDLAAECSAWWLVKQAGLLQKGQPDGPDRQTLTPAERRVAEQAAQGRSNQDISRELGITSRAVEKHLTNSYRKLGVKGRKDLAAAVGRLLPHLPQQSRSGQPPRPADGGWR